VVVSLCCGAVVWQLDFGMLASQTQSAHAAAFHALSLTPFPSLYLAVLTRTHRYHVPFSLCV
jgi:hypothetical protein